MVLYILVKVSDLFIEGFNYFKLFIIIFDFLKDISKKIMEDLDRGVIILKGEGVYIGENKNVFLVVVEKKEVVELKKLVKNVDFNVFIIIIDIYEVLGNGFKKIE